jgi:hypothetical protein
LLVSQFATRWGTSHESGGRTIWFRLDRPDTLPVRTAEPGVAPTAQSLEATLTGVLGPGVPMTVASLLARLAAGMGASTITVSVDRGDGRGEEVLAGTTPRRRGRPMPPPAAPCGSGCPWRGRGRPS